MLDTYIIRESSGTSHINSTVSVTENKAPTDESIKIYHELLSKAKREVISAIGLGEINNNLVLCDPTVKFARKKHLGGLILSKDEDFHHGDLVCQYRFWLNGQEYKGEFFLPFFYLSEDKEPIIKTAKKFLFHHLSRAIAEKLVEQFSKNNTEMMKEVQDRLPAQ